MASITANYTSSEKGLVIIVAVGGIMLMSAPAPKEARANVNGGVKGKGPQGGKSTKGGYHGTPK